MGVRKTIACLNQMAGLEGSMVILLDYNLAFFIDPLGFYLVEQALSLLLD